MAQLLRRPDARQAHRLGGEALHIEGSIGSAQYGFGAVAATGVASHII